MEINTNGDAVSTTSQLIIKEADRSHSGNYTCWPTTANSATVLINVVLRGKQSCVYFSIRS